MLFLWKCEKQKQKLFYKFSRGDDCPAMIIFRGQLFVLFRLGDQNKMKLIKFK